MRPRLFSVALLCFNPLSFCVFASPDGVSPLPSLERSPRHDLYMAHPWLMWINVVPDILIFLAYALLFAGMSLVIKKLSDIDEIRPWLWTIHSFRIFILTSGLMGLFRVLYIWFPIYQFSLGLKLVCALASVPTAIIFARSAPLMSTTIRRFFTLLTREQTQGDTLRKSQEFLDRTGKIAGIGGWEVDLEKNVVTWSTETYRIHGASLDYKPTLEEGLKVYAPEARPTIISAVLTASAGGPGWDLELPIIRLDGRRIMVRSVGEVDCRDGKPVRLLGAFQDITAQVAARDALREANERVALATESGGIGIWDWNIGTGDLYCDPQMYRLHGKTPETGADTLWRDHVHPEDHDRIIQALNDAIEGTRPYDDEFRLIWPDGSIHHLRGAARVTRDESGKATRVIGINWDISAIVETRNELRIANQRAALATESGGIGIFDWDIKQDLCIADPWMHRLYGLQPPGKATPLAYWSTPMHPEDRDDVIEALEDAMAGRRPYDTEFRVIWQDGSIHHVRATGRVTRDETGAPVHIIGVNWDVTESRRLTAELAEQHDLLRVTLQSIGDGVITTDVRRNVSWLNPVAERMAGWTTAEACGRPLLEIFRTLNAETRQPTDNPVANFIAQGNVVGLARQTLLISRNGTEFGIENQAAPIRDSNGVLIGNVLVFRDVTEQRRLAAETEQISKLQLELKTKDEFLSHVSHELRSPLTSIYSFTSIIVDGLAGETTSDQKEYLQIVLKNVVQLQSMIEDLLTVTQSREGKLNIELQSVEPRDAISDALHTLSSAAATKQIVLSATETTSVPSVCADPTRLRQVLIILLDNAIKFTPQGGSVTVSVSESHVNRLLFQVTDTGCGIPEEKRTLVFENLYQITGPAPPDTTQQGRIGLGLGLHIARNLVTRQGGTIWVTAAPEGGSVFNFTLPAYTEGCLDEASDANLPRRRKTDRQFQERPALLPAA